METFYSSLIAGSAAGAAVDVILYPLDTLKTRLQSSQGFIKSGGFTKLYRGIGPVIVGSAPNAAAFFCTYDVSKEWMENFIKSKNNPGIHMIAASLGEIVACVIRVPVEILKQRRQAYGIATIQIISDTLKTEGIKGFYRGYLSTVFREIPFSIIQFPLWEFFKWKVSEVRGSCSPFDSCLCGALAGGLSAAITTPIDVAKTRIMLAKAGSSEAKGSIIPVLRVVFKQKGITGLFAGVVPRTMAISFGGSIFFGTYELVKHMLFKNR